MKNYTQAPLPFQGQKRKFLKDVTKIINQCPDNAIFVDLFGGSGLLSHTVKKIKPNSKVIYNDFDNYSLRLSNVDETNYLLSKIREITEGLKKGTTLNAQLKASILDVIRDHENTYGWVDFITISSSLLFSANYATNYESLLKNTFYSNIRKTEYITKGYLDNLEIVSENYTTLFDRYKDIDNVIFLVDPPYLSTDCSTYTSDNYWKLKDYLDVLNVLVDTNYLYFTSNKSQVIELCEWMETRTNNGDVNPFKNSTTISISTSLNHTSKYTDIMLYKTKWTFI